VSIFAHRGKKRSPEIETNSCSQWRAVSEVNSSNRKAVYKESNIDEARKRTFGATMGNENVDHATIMDRDWAHEAVTHNSCARDLDGF